MERRGAKNDAVKPSLGECSYHNYIAVSWFCQPFRKVSGNIEYSDKKISASPFLLGNFSVRYHADTLYIVYRITDYRTGSGI